MTMTVVVDKGSLGSVQENNDSIPYNERKEKLKHSPFYKLKTIGIKKVSQADVSLPSEMRFYCAFHSVVAIMIEFSILPEKSRNHVLIPFH